MGLANYRANPGLHAGIAALILENYTYVYYGLVLQTYTKNCVAAVILQTYTTHYHNYIVARILLQLYLQFRRMHSCIYIDALIPQSPTADLYFRLTL